MKKIILFGLMAFMVSFGVVALQYGDELTQEQLDNKDIMTFPLNPAWDKPNVWTTRVYVGVPFWIDYLEPQPSGTYKYVQKYVNETAVFRKHQIKKCIADIFDKYGDYFVSEDDRADVKEYCIDKIGIDTLKYERDNFEYGLRMLFISWQTQDDLSIGGGDLDI